ncbi:MAG TPA: serine hydrolase [Pseudonocardia sp.]|nr:serine hydrolase [Pseudonocardia sp.]
MDRRTVRRMWASAAVCALAVLLAAPAAVSGSGAVARAASVPGGGDPARPVEGTPPASAAGGTGGLLASLPESGSVAALSLSLPRTGLAPAAVEAAQATAAGSTELAVAVLDRATGELTTGERGREPFYTASLSKVVVAVDVLDRRRSEGLSVSAEDLTLLQRALGPSDDEAMNVLWTRFDGVGAIGRVAARLGLYETTAPRDPSQWGEVSTSAADTVRLWEYVLGAMPAADRDFLVDAMEAAPAVARDGFDQAFGLLSRSVDGPGGPGAVAKQGWMCCFSRQYHLHSVGVVGPDERFLVALLSRLPRDPGWDTARTELDAVAAEVVRALA